MEYVGETVKLMFFISGPVLDCMVWSSHDGCTENVRYPQCYIATTHLPYNPEIVICSNLSTCNVTKQE